MIKHLHILGIFGLWGLIMMPQVMADCDEWIATAPPLFPTNEWGAVTNDCELGLRVPKFEYTVGEPIVGRIVLQYLGDKKISYGSREWFNFDIIVTRADGQNVPLQDSWVKTQELHRGGGSDFSVRLEPHKEQLFPSCVDVTERYQMDIPSIYIISVKQRFAMAEYTPREEEATKTSKYIKRPFGIFDLLSNPVQISITATNRNHPQLEKSK